MNKLAILQPSYIPWIGFFEQLDKVDVFVLYDDVQYTKNDWRNRNRIKLNNSIMWLSVPVLSVQKQRINEVKIDYSRNWVNKHLNALKTNYSKARNFQDIFPLIEKALQKKYIRLLDLNLDLIKVFQEYLGINTKIYLSSELNVTGDKNTRLINICKHFNASIYYSGEAAKDYLDISLFNQNNIKIEFQNFKHKAYPQQFGLEFIEYMSIIDLLLNCGKDSINFIRNDFE